MLDINNDNEVFPINYNDNIQIGMYSYIKNPENIAIKILGGTGDFITMSTSNSVFIPIIESDFYIMPEYITIPDSNFDEMPEELQGLFYNSSDETSGIDNISKESDALRLYTATKITKPIKVRVRKTDTNTSISAIIIK